MGSGISGTIDVVDKRTARFWVSERIYHIGACQFLVLICTDVVLFTLHQAGELWNEAKFDQFADSSGNVTWDKWVQMASDDEVGYKTLGPDANKVRYAPPLFPFL